MPMRVAPEIPPIINKTARYRHRRGDTHKIRVTDDKTFDYFFILLRSNSAGAINQSAAFFQVKGSTIQYCFLQNGTFFQVVRGGSPFYFGIPSQSTET
jgi:hypothetical protein